MTSTQTRNPNLDIETLQRSGQALPLSDTLELGSQDWWTGPLPSSPDCPGRNARGFIEALPQIPLDTCSRQEVQAYFANGWVLTELLFSALRNEQAFYQPPYHGLRHPLVFYYVHPAVLYINKLHVAGLIAQPLHPYYERLFETGVDEMSWDDLTKNEMDWPSLRECQVYRRRCYKAVSELIATHPDLAPGHPPITESSPLWALFLGFEHERIHLETSSVLMRELPLSLLQRPTHFAPLHPSAKLWTSAEKAPFQEPPPSQNPWTLVEEGRVVLGKDPSFPSFGWDNEYGQEERHVSSFACTQTLITNGAFYRFVKAGGYREECWWTAEGWRWRTFRNVKWPTFWVPSGPQGAHEYALRTLFELVHMPWDWPVVVNFHEAKAYAAWLTAEQKVQHPLRLLTEAEHHRLRQDFAGWQESSQREQWHHHLQDNKALLGLRWGSEGPVVRSDAASISDVFGNVWHWLEDHFTPLPGFTVHSYYDDFSTPCFDGRHQMIMGGSFISAGDEASLYARFHFRPHFFQHAGFRLVDPLSPHNDGVAGRIWEEEASQEEHRGQRLAERAWSLLAPLSELVLDGIVIPRDDREALLQTLQELIPQKLPRALDIGCGTGGLSYQLTAHALSVLGVDLSLEALEFARQWQTQQSVKCPYDAQKTIPLDPERLQRLDWRQCDAGSLPADFVDFDLVVCSRILSQLPSPKSLLGRMGGARGLVRVGGLLVLLDTYQFRERTTPSSLWVGSQPEALQKLLGEGFRCEKSGPCFHVERSGQRTVTIEELSVSYWRRLS